MLKLTEGLYLPDWDYIHPLVLQYAKNTLLFRYHLFYEDNPVEQELVLTTVLYNDEQIEEVYNTLLELCTTEVKTLSS